MNRFALRDAVLLTMCTALLIGCSVGPIGEADIEPYLPEDVSVLSSVDDKYGTTEPWRLYVIVRDEENETPEQFLARWAEHVETRSDVESVEVVVDELNFQAPDFHVAVMPAELLVERAPMGVDEALDFDPEDGLQFGMNVLHTPGENGS